MMIILPVKRHGTWYEQLTALEDIQAIHVYNSVNSQEQRIVVLVTENNKGTPYSYVLACSTGNITETCVTGRDILTCSHTQDGYDTFTGTVRTFSSPWYTWKKVLSTE